MCHTGIREGYSCYANFYSVKLNNHQTHNWESFEKERLVFNSLLIGLPCTRSPNWSLHLPYKPLKSTLSLIYLFLELISCGYTRDFSRLCKSYCIPIHLRRLSDLQNNNGEKRGGEFAQTALHRRNNVFAGNMFLKIKRYGKGLPQGYSADGGSG